MNEQQEKRIFVQSHTQNPSYWILFYCLDYNVTCYADYQHSN